MMKKVNVKEVKTMPDQRRIRLNDKAYLNGLGYLGNQGICFKTKTLLFLTNGDNHEMQFGSSLVNS